MKPFIYSFLIAFVFLFTACNTQSTSEDIVVAVEIDFAEEKEMIHKVVQIKSGSTALEALQSACITETHPVGKYVFVNSIEGVAGVPQKKGWYYKVNDVAPKVLAISKTLKDGDVMCWIYKTDVCSDKKKGDSEE